MKIEIDREQARTHFEPWIPVVLLFGFPSLGFAALSVGSAWRGEWQVAAVLALLPGLMLAGLFARPIRDLAAAVAASARHRAASRSTYESGQSRRSAPPARLHEHP